MTSLEPEPKKDGALWCLLPVKMNEHARIKFDFDVELPSVGHDEDVLDNYTPEKLIAEKHTALPPLAIIGPRDTPRMYAQLGVFTVTHRDQIAIEDVADASHLGRFVIPAGSKKDLASELRYLKITKLTLFPELDNVAQLSIEGLK